MQDHSGGPTFTSSELVGKLVEGKVSSWISILSIQKLWGKWYFKDSEIGWLLLRSLETLEKGNKKLRPVNSQLQVSVEASGLSL